MPQSSPVLLPIVQRELISLNAFRYWKLRGKIHECAEMKFWGKMIVPVRKVWTEFADRLHFRKTGLVKLRRDVRSCEYEDIQILWEMLKRYEREMARSSTGYRRRRRLSMVYCAPFLCHGM